MEGFVWLPLKEYEEMKADLASLVDHAEWLGKRLSSKNLAMDMSEDFPSEVQEVKERRERVRAIAIKYP